MKKIKFLFYLLGLILNLAAGACALGQTPSCANMPRLDPYAQQEPATGVATAKELWSALSYWAKNSCSSPHTIHFAAKVEIDLGELDPAVFPLVVPMGISLEGDYEMSDVIFDEGKSRGTRIFFPWLYEYAQENTVCDILHPSSTTDDDFGSAFKMSDKSTITKVCLYGPRTDTKDWRFGIWIGQYIDPCRNELVKPLEGVNSGILVNGNDCHITYCEIYGFGHYAVQVRDMLFTDSTFPYPILTPSDCYDNTLKQGTFHFDHNYVHNCKAYGWGYGLYIASGSGVATCPTFASATACSTYVPPPPPPNPPYTTAFFENKFASHIRPEEIAYIENNYFFENKHDIDYSGRRLSLHVRQNTFSQRSADVNINSHDGDKWLCYPLENIYEGNNTTPTNLPVIYEVGGSQVFVEKNVFYKKAGNMKLLYPNTNLCNDNTYNYLPAKIEINGNYFATFQGSYTAAGAGTNLDWATTATDMPRDGYDKIQIASRNHYNYIYKWGFGGFTNGDDAIQIDEAVSPPDPNICEPMPLSGGSKTPLAEISSSVTASGVTDNSPKVVAAWQDVYFDAHACADKNRISPPINDMLYFWRFHDQAKTIESEFRTTNLNIATKIPHKLPIGITNVTLMAIDKTAVAGGNEWRASDLAKQLITVIPPTPTIGNNHCVSFWIKDTYVGRKLQPHTYMHPPSTWATNGVENGAEPPPANPAGTGFVKYLKINGDILWQDDIEGDEGWQQVILYLGDDYMQGKVEIGVMTTGIVSVQDVRGVTVYVDDVYMNCNEGNAIANGDFESYNENLSVHSPVSLSPLNWSPLSEKDEAKLMPSPFIRYDSCNGPPGKVTPLSYIENWTWNAEDPRITTDEVRSGFLACQLWVMGISPELCDGLLYYNAPFVYKAINQPFDVTGCFHCINCEEKNIKVFPNPALEGKAVTVAIEGTAGEQKNLDIYNVNGSLAGSAAFATDTYELTQQLAPGSYVLKINCKGETHVQKLVITH